METRSLRDRIIVQRLGGEQKVDGFVLPDNAEENPQRQGEVILTGSGKTSEGRRIPLDVKAGDIVLFGKLSGQEINFAGEEYLILREDEVLAVINSASRTGLAGERGTRKAIPSPNPKEKYTPSEGLVSLLKEHSLALSKEESATLRAQANSTGRSVVEARDLASLIGERIEGLLGNLARRAAASGRDVVLLADSQRFPPEISAELVDRLDVDPYCAQEFLDDLHRDLREFAAVPRVRSWGRIATDRGNLVLTVAVDKAKRPDFSDLFERPWVVTK